MSGRGNPGPDLFPDTRPCGELTMVVVLVDVDLTVSAGVSQGDRLPVSLVDGRYPAVFLGQDRLGSIAAGALSRLVECLRGGDTFGAEVLAVDGAFVQVRITGG